MQRGRREKKKGAAMAYRLFLFDLDGTLVDTSPGILEALRRMEQELGIEPLPQKTLEKFIGPPLEWSIETYYGADAETAARWAKVYRRIYGEGGCIRHSRLYPYIRESLELIRQQGGKSAVTSLKIDEMVTLTLDVYGLVPCFDTLVGRSDACPTKADTIREAMRRLHWTDAESAVLFGDSRYDGEGAMQAGVAFVPLTYGFGFAEEGSMDGLECVTVAREPADVFRFIRAQFTPQES